MRTKLIVMIALILTASLGLLAKVDHGKIGQEVSIPVHLQDGEEFRTPTRELIAYGKQLFTAMWTSPEGAGRPLTKGTGAALADASDPLIFPRNFNRISGPDTNSCSGCHNKPFVGGGGDIANNVFVLGQRFDFATFNTSDGPLTKGAFDERGLPATLQTIANSRKTVGMFGSGFIEMLARQITADLQTQRNSIGPGESKALVSKGISFGVLRRSADGAWDVSQVEGLAAPNLLTTGANEPPPA